MAGSLYERAREEATGIALGSPSDASVEAVFEACTDVPSAAATAQKWSVVRPVQLHDCWKPVSVQ